MIDAQCSEYHIPTCTYPFEGMEAAQLERSAMRPYLYMHKLASLDPQCLRQRLMKLKLGPSDLATPVSSPGRPIVPLPGGRFIIAPSVAGSVGIWDISVDLGHEKCNEPRCLVSIGLPVDARPAGPNNIRALPTSLDNVWRIVASYDRGINTEGGYATYIASVLGVG
ncbi:hypothetical protein DL93DRAFT_2087243 [Clavulina sp. PMI_390]|nr:hypothetical protein DL93DRAFT_2087243 [Clavulina sp. PMI_390]